MHTNKLETCFNPSLQNHGNVVVKFILPETLSASEVKAIFIDTRERVIDLYGWERVMLETPFQCSDESFYVNVSAGVGGCPCAGFFSTCF